VYDGNKDSTTILLNQLLKLFPLSEVIYSGWDQKIPKIKGVKYVFNNNPGNYINIKFLKNAKRLIKSSYTGIAEASNKIIVKLRSDTYVTSSLKENLMGAIKKISKKRIAICLHSTPALPFMLDDKIQIGFKTSMLKFWSPDFEFVKKTYLYFFAKYKLNLHQIYNNKKKHLGTEQILFLSFCRPSIQGGYYNTYVTSVDCIRNNFIYLNAPKLGFRSQKFSYKNSIRLKIYLQIINSLQLNMAALILLLIKLFKRSYIKINRIV
jgi:hypothetical protein